MNEGLGMTDVRQMANISCSNVAALCYKNDVSVKYSGRKFTLKREKLFLKE